MTDNRLVVAWVAVVAGALAPLPARGADAPGVAEEAAEVAVSATGPATQSVEVRRGMEMQGSREERERRFYERLMQRVEPTGRADPARVAAYVEAFQREFVDDARLFVFRGA